MEASDAVNDRIFRVSIKEDECTPFSCRLVHCAGRGHSAVLSFRISVLGYMQEDVVPDTLSLGRYPH